MIHTTVPKYLKHGFIYKDHFWFKQSCEMLFINLKAQLGAHPTTDFNADMVYYSYL